MRNQPIKDIDNTGSRGELGTYAMFSVQATSYGDLSIRCKSSVQALQMAAHNKPSPGFAARPPMRTASSSSRQAPLSHWPRLAWRAHAHPPEMGVGVDSVAGGGGGGITGISLHSATRTTARMQCRLRRNTSNGETTRNQNTYAHAIQPSTLPNTEVIKGACFKGTPPTKKREQFGPVHVMQ